MDWVDILFLISSTGILFLFPGCTCCGETGTADCSAFTGSDLAEVYRFTISGMTDNGCADCPNWDGTWDLEFTGQVGAAFNRSCIWATTDDCNSECGHGTLPRWTLFFSEASSTWFLVAQGAATDGSSFGGDLASYSPPPFGFNPLGSSTFNLGGGSYDCSGLPSSVTVSAV